MITYNGIIEYFKEVANKHTQINGFSFGDIDDADLDKITEYPLLHVGVTGANIDERVISYDINIMLIEVIDDKGDRKTNEKYALSNTLQILQDLQTEFLKGSSIVTPETKLTGNALSCQPITGNYNNRVVGWATVITIEGINNSEACNIPYELITSWNYQTPTPPIATLVSNGYSWYSATEQQQGNIDYRGGQFVFGWTPIIDGVSEGTLTGQLSTLDEKLEYDFKNNAIHISGVDPVNFYSEHTIADKEHYFIKMKNITGGQNEIFSLSTGSELVQVIISSGNLYLKRNDGTTTPIKQISGLPISNPKISENNAIIREESLTICLVHHNATTSYLYYGGLARVELTTLSMSGTATASLGVSANLSADVLTNFMVEEYIYTKGDLSSGEIQNTIKWLNAK